MNLSIEKELEKKNFHFKEFAESPCIASLKKYQSKEEDVKIGNLPLINISFIF